VRQYDGCQFGAGRADVFYARADESESVIQKQRTALTDTERMRLPSVGE